MTLPTTDEAPPGFDLFANFHLAITDLTKEIRKANRSEQRRLASLPNYVALSKMSSPGAATTDFQDLGSPQPGRCWIVRLLVAIASPDAANAAKVTWYVGNIMPGPAAGQLPITMARWQFPSVPGFQNFTSDVFKVFPQEHLIAGLTGIPASSNIALTACVNDQPIWAQAGPVAVE
jgi:hypothetical protein